MNDDIKYDFSKSLKDSIDLTLNLDKQNIDKVNKQNKPANHSHFGHRQRLRGIVNNTDILSLPEHQILELMLTFVLPQKDVNPLAHDILNEFGSLANVFEASTESLTKIKGVGEVTANYLSFCSKIPEIYKNSKANTKLQLNTVRDIIKFFSSIVDFTSVEKFYYVCLNAKGDVLCSKNIGSGGVSQLYINNREFIQQILKYPTQTVIVCHTHPHGEPKPSEEDLAFTKTLLGLLDPLNIRLCDHLILSPDGHYSFFQNKILGGPLKNGIFGNLKMNILSSKSFVYNNKNKDLDENIINPD